MSLHDRCASETVRILDPVNAAVEAVAQGILTGDSRMKKKRLSDANQWIIQQCQQLNFGRITFLVSRGEPDVTQPWHTRRTVKLAGVENGPRPEADLSDFELCQEQLALISTLSRTPDATQITVEVRHGLPFIAEIEQDHLAA